MHELYTYFTARQDDRRPSDVVWRMISEEKKFTATSMTRTPGQVDDRSFEPPPGDQPDAWPAALDEDCFCHHCGYNFRTLCLTPDSTCPECGKVVAVSIDPARFRPIPRSELWRRVRRGNAWCCMATLAAAFGPLGVLGAMLFLDWLRLFRHVDDDLVGGCLVGVVAMLDGLGWLIGSRSFSRTALASPTGRYRGLSRRTLISAAVLASLPCLILAVRLSVGPRPDFWFTYPTWMQIVIVLVLAAVAARLILVAVVGRWYRRLLRDLGRLDLERLARGYTWLLMISGLVLIAGIVLVQTNDLWRHWLPLSLQQSDADDVVMVTAVTGGCIGGWIGCGAVASLFYRVGKHLRSPQP
ncbi:MAG: hypothetical protein IT442_10880 [Phycisphaeraceae bacterium]|nr:hypothetical protein [Phycisphaeraceae bacterium]